jgi:hypothetical protein
MTGRLIRLAPLVVIVAAGACGPSQQDADAAMKQAMDAITAQHAETLRYAPAAFDALMAGYDTAQTAYKAKDYRKAVAAAHEVETVARHDLPTTIRNAKQRVADRVDVLRDSVQQMLAVLDKRVGARGNARTQLDSLKASMVRVLAAEQRGDVADALHAVMRVQTGAAELAQKVMQR